ncbi:PIR protein, putative [Plasmodium sp.]|nr:PIR protein, putative [Plasmodium sp.]
MVAENNKTKPYITPHAPSITSRVLSECDLYMTNYDNDPDMKSVKENFHRKTSQRFEEYNERMKDKRQKCKEQCDKDIQKIILKDKVEKSLALKVEKVCLMCACGLGGGVGPVWGLVSGLWYATWSQYVATIVPKAATDAGIAEGVKVGLVKVKEIAIGALRNTISIPELKVGDIITAGHFTDGVSLDGVLKAMDTFMLETFDESPYAAFSTWVQAIANPSKLKSFSAEAAEITKAFTDAKTGILTKTGNATSSLTTAITASIIAIVVIVLVMVIIYLILRYFRKKKMKKKLQYTKLLKE